MTQPLAIQPANLGPSTSPIIDVRTDMEHAQSRLGLPHDHVPLDTLDPADYMQRRGLDPDDPVYILCRSGGRAGKAAQKFIDAGYKNAHVITGGLTACTAAGCDVISNDAAAPSSPGLGAIPLERQVRIAAGGLVVLGTFLGALLGDFFYIIPFAVGCGLIFAGVTDRCGMALLLTKAPWNKTNGASCATTSCSVTPGSTAKKEEGACS